MFKNGQNASSLRNQGRISKVLHKSVGEIDVEDVSLLEAYSEFDEELWWCILKILTTAHVSHLTSATIIVITIFSVFKSVELLPKNQPQLIHRPKI